MAQRPPGPGRKDGSGGDAASHLHQAGSQEIHGDGKRGAADTEIEIARNGEVGGEPRVFEVAHTARGDAGAGELIVKPRGETAAEVGADSFMQGRKVLQKNEDSTGEGRG